MLSDAVPPAETVLVEKNIVFARTETGELLLDLYRPARAGQPVPVVLWLHGGGWFTGDRTLAPDLPQHVRATGCAMAAVEYRLSGQAVFPAQLHDVRAAIRFLRDSAEDHNLDPRRVGAWGSSAGGHLAALAALTGHLPSLPGEQATRTDPSVQAVAVSCPPVDFLATGATSLPDSGSATPEARLLGGHPARYPERARQASPLNWVSPAAPPFQISHGTADVLVPPRHSERLHQALAAAGVLSELYLLDGYRHGFLNPAGRLDVELRTVMDDGRLETAGTAPASYHTSSAAAPKRTTFAFADIDHFFRDTLTAPPTTGDTPCP